LDAADPRSTPPEHCRRSGSTTICRIRRAPAGSGTWTPASPPPSRRSALESWRAADRERAGANDGDACANGEVGKHDPTLVSDGCRSMDLVPGNAFRRRTPANAATDDRSDTRDSPYVNSIFQQPWWLDAV